MGHSGNRRGITTTEFFFAILILALALIPIYDIFIGSYRSVFRSKFSYMAQHVARETMEELRQVPFDTLDNLGHDWQPVQGHSLGMTPLEPGVDGSDTTLNYPEVYQRIETALSFEPVQDKSGAELVALKKAILQIRWQERGAGGLVSQKILEKFETLIADHDRRSRRGP